MKTRVTKRLGVLPHVGAKTAPVRRTPKERLEVAPSKPANRGERRAAAAMGRKQ